MSFDLFDLHCDTAYEMLRTGQSLTDNRLAVSLTGAKKVFSRYVQIMAHWTDDALSDEAGWEQLLAMHRHLLQDDAIREGHAVIATTIPSDANLPTLLLSVEDARVLANKIERVDTLFQMGFRFLTPLWAGSTCIGGSHDTDVGLTDFGKRALSRAVELGMLLDISHASLASSEEILALSAAQGRPAIASHSNVYDVRPVSRNLQAWQVEALLRCDGIIGLNLHVPFLTDQTDATVDDVLRHVDAFLAMGAEKALCLGGDMDGAWLPTAFDKVEKLSQLAEEMLRRNYSEDTVRGMFFENAHRFACKHLQASL